MKYWQLQQKMSLPYEAKVKHAIIRAREFYSRLNGNVYVGVGGLDSLTLLYFIRKYINKDIPGATISSAEDKSIQTIHQSIDNMVFLTPLKSKIQILKEYGYPIISKDKATKVAHLQKPDNPSQVYVHAIMTGQLGEQGNYKYSEKMKLADKWISLFGGLYSLHRLDLDCHIAPFKVSAECCKWIKEKPSELYQKASGRYPYLGLMISEGGQRKLGLIKNGCNYFGKTVTRSCPFFIFSKTDLLQLALDLNVPIPEIYGDIIKLPDGSLTTTKAKRTGCSMCGFGVHLEKRPHRFDRLRLSNPKEWEFWIYNQGWGEVLSYIGVEWE